MELLEIIYNSILFIASVMAIVLVFSYISYKYKKKTNGNYSARSHKTNDFQPKPKIHNRETFIVKDLDIKNNSQIKAKEISKKETKKEKPKDKRSANRLRLLNEELPENDSGITKSNYEKLNGDFLEKYHNNKSDDEFHPLKTDKK